MKQAAIDSIKSHLGTKGIGQVAKILGLEDGAIDKLLSTRVEAAVHDLKAARSTPGPGTAGGWTSSPRRTSGSLGEGSITPTG